MMGTYDTRGGHPLHDPMADFFPPCDVCGGNPDSDGPGSCACPECPGCESIGGCEHWCKVKVAPRCMRDIGTKAALRLCNGAIKITAERPRTYACERCHVPHWRRKGETGVWFEPIKRMSSLATWIIFALALSAATGLLILAWMWG